jgi:hypothetical protein
VSVNPQPLVVEGITTLTDHWTLDLPGPFQRRKDDESIVFWRPGLTIFAVVWRNNRHQTKNARLSEVHADISPTATDVEVVRAGRLLRITYRLDEDAPEHEEDDEKPAEGSVPALHTFIFGESGHVQLACYFDEESEAALAKAIARTVDEREWV